MEGFSRQSGDVISGMRQAGEDSAARLRTMGAAMEASGEQLSRSYGSFVENVVEALSRALGMFDQSMSGMVSALTEKINAGGSLSAGQISELQRLLTSMEQSLNRAADSLDARKGG